MTALLAAGADALYVGEKGWSRGGRNAGLSPGEIREAAEECRRRGASLAVAMNTVPGSTEVAGFLAVIDRLVGDGVSAVVLSDPGIIRRVRQEFPLLPITASVGLSAVNPSEACFYRDLGADTIVLPTALSPGEIPAIKSASGLRVEVFAHCRPEVILQGKCALSGYALEARPAPERPGTAAAGTPSSAKRGGRCFLACRSLPLAREAHSIEEELPRWIAAGVDAFKVEGRDLPRARVLEIVARFRDRLDAALSRTR